METQNPFSDRYQLLGDHADPLRSNPPIRSFSRPFTSRKSSGSNTIAMDVSTARNTQAESTSGDSEKSQNGGAPRSSSAKSRSCTTVWFSRKRVLGIYLPIICLIALVVGLVAAFVPAATKSDSDRKQDSPKDPHDSPTTDAQSHKHHAVTTQTFVIPSTITHGSEKVTTHVTSKTTQMIHITGTTKTQGVIQITTTWLSESSADIPRSETPTSESVSVRTTTIPTTSTVYRPSEVSLTPHTSQAGQGLPVSAAAESSSHPANPNAGAHDPQVDASATPLALTPEPESVELSLSSSKNLETPGATNLGTRSVLVNGVSQPAATPPTTTTEHTFPVGTTQVAKPHNQKTSETSTTTLFTSYTTNRSETSNVDDRSKISSAETTKTQQANSNPVTAIVNSKGLFAIPP